MVFRLIFLILFLIIGVLFTVGYNFFPLINFKNELYKGKIYIDKIELTSQNVSIKESNVSVPSSTNAPTNNTITYKYSNLPINNSYKMVLNYLYYGCIITSCLIGSGIVLSYLQMKFFSKILFILAQTFMTTFVGIIIFMYYSSSFIKSLIPYGNSNAIPEEYKNVKPSYDSGSILIILSSIMMIVNYIVYSFIG